MYKELWNRFSDNYSENCLAWNHELAPILPPSGDGWQSRWTANPDFLTVGGRLLLYYRGSGRLAGDDEDHDRIGVSEVLSIGPNTLELKPLNEGQPVVVNGAPEDFDGIDVLDPATVLFKGKVFLYYSAIGPGPDSVGLAVSDDGEHFSKVGFVMVGRAPDVIEFDGKLRMVYQKADDAGNYKVYLAESEDGYTFHDLVDEPVFVPTPGSWDSLSIATVRLELEDGLVYAMYGGSSYLADEPDFFGLARSQDMVTWEFHPGNPVFGCGPKGAPDGGAMWFPALHETPEAFVLLYEGSRGKYGWDISSTICMASLGTMRGMDLKELALNGFKSATKMLTQDLEALPDEKIDAPLGGKARSVADFIYEVTLVNDHVGMVMRGEEPFLWPHGDWIKAPEDLKGKAAVLEALQKSSDKIIETIEAMSEEEIEATVQTEHGERTRYQRIQFMTLHMWYHSGQLNYIQTLLGDDQWHWT